MTEAPMDLDWYALSDEEIRQFDDHGYLIVRNVLNQQIMDRIIDVSDRLLASDERENRTPGHNGFYDAFRNCIAMN
ncbi:MAG: hypothetical protein O7G87_20200 [bacterium]|nr:hypothetical protein [bacterium]